MSGTAHEMALNAASKCDMDTLWAALDISCEARDTERNDGRTPLHFAAESGHKECVERASADKDARKKESWTQLHLAPREGARSVWRCCCGWAPRRARRTLEVRRSCTSLLERAQGVRGAAASRGRRQERE
jgi:hypothetical protein